MRLRRLVSGDDEVKLAAKLEEVGVILPRSFVLRVMLRQWWVGFSQICRALAGPCPWACGGPAPTPGTNVLLHNPRPLASALIITIAITIIVVTAIGNIVGPKFPRDFLVVELCIGDIGHHTLKPAMIGIDRVAS